MMLEQPPRLQPDRVRLVVGEQTARRPVALGEHEPHLRRRFRGPDHGDAAIAPEVPLAAHAVEHPLAVG